jgi:histidinol-phosphate phosphatase family protein
VFLDRDGTLIDHVGYLGDPEQVRLVPGTADALAALQRRGFRLAVVSNQSGVGRGLISGAEAAAVHARFVDELEHAGIRLDDVRYCPHAPDDGCACRKPLPGLIFDAAQMLGVDLAASFVVGDKAVDIEAGTRAGCATVLLASGTPDACEPDCVARDWDEVLDWIVTSGRAA